MSDKVALHAELVAALEAERERLVRAQKATAEGVTHEDARAEGDKDMRATEASYVARGQALRVEALDGEVARVRAHRPRGFGPDDAIELGALVTVEGRAGRTVVYLAAGGAGTRLGPVQVVTPASPLGRALIGARLGDAVEVVRGGGPEELEIVALA